MKLLKLFTIYLFLSTNLFAQSASDKAMAWINSNMIDEHANCYVFYKISEEKNGDAEYVMSQLKEALKLPKNKLVFVGILHQFDDKKCSIEFLEYYFRDAEFRKIFLENYVFLTRITNTLKSSEDLNIINRDAEVYIRK